MNHDLEQQTLAYWELMQKVNAPTTESFTTVGKAIRFCVTTINKLGPHCQLKHQVQKLLQEIICRPE
jgi:hypothetical protein